VSPLPTLDDLKQLSADIRAHAAKNDDAYSRDPGIEEGWAKRIDAAIAAVEAGERKEWRVRSSLGDVREVPYQINAIRVSQNWHIAAPDAEIWIGSRSVQTIYSDWTESRFVPDPGPWRKEGL
jgi:hypothetical protein